MPELIEEILSEVRIRPTPVPILITSWRKQRIQTVPGNNDSQAARVASHPSVVTVSGA
jgi:hypothetical protein